MTTAIIFAVKRSTFHIWVMATVNDHQRVHEIISLIAFTVIFDAFLCRLHFPRKLSCKYLFNSKKKRKSTKTGIRRVRTTFPFAHSRSLSCASFVHSSSVKVVVRLTELCYRQHILYYSFSLSLSLAHNHSMWAIRRKFDVKESKEEARIYVVNKEVSLCVIDRVRGEWKAEKVVDVSAHDLCSQPTYVVVLLHVNNILQRTIIEVSWVMSFKFIEHKILQNTHMHAHIHLIIITQTHIHSDKQPFEITAQTQHTFASVRMWHWKCATNFKGSEGNQWT